MSLSGLGEHKSLQIDAVVMKKKLATSGTPSYFRPAQPDHVWSLFIG
jgi:hypothetical protein